MCSSQTDEQIKPVPEMGAFNTDYLDGLGALEERILILIDIDMLLSSTEMRLINELAVKCGQAQQNYANCSL
jgi:purine-binding chemotaxis protein CheW